MIEVDLRKAGRGCMDNPVAVLSNYVEKKLPLRILVSREDLPLVREILELAEYKEVREEEREGYYVVEAR